MMPAREPATPNLRGTTARFWRYHLWVGDQALERPGTIILSEPYTAGTGLIQSMFASSDLSLSLYSSSVLPYHRYLADFERSKSAPPFSFGALPKHRHWLPFFSRVASETSPWTSPSNSLARRHHVWVSAQLWLTFIMSHSDEWIEHLAQDGLRLESIRATHEGSVESKSRQRALFLDDIHSVQLEAAALKSRQFQLKQSLQKMVQSLKQVDGELLQARTAIKEVDHAAEELRWGRLRIQEFPEDILRLVFEHSVTESRHMQWVLPSVCGSWRGIALSTPSLWTHCAVTMLLERTSSAEGILRSVANSGTCPLDLDITFQDRNMTPEEASPMMSALLPPLVHRQRLRSLKMTILSSLPRPSTMSLVVPVVLQCNSGENSLSRLHSFHAIFPESTELYLLYSEKITAICQEASELRLIKLANVSLTSSLSQAFSPHLREVELSYVEAAPGDVLRLIQSLPELRSFTLVFYDDAWDVPDIELEFETLQSVVHEALRELRLGAIQHPARILAHLHCPHLQLFSLCGLDDAFQSRLDLSVLKLMKASGSLESLELRYVFIDGDYTYQFVDALASLPLKILDWRSILRCHDRVLEALHTSYTLPALERLTLAHCSLRHLLNWLAYRQKGQARRLAYLRVEARANVVEKLDPFSESVDVPSHLVSPSGCYSHD